MPYSVEYNFYPDDIVWVLNRNEFSVKRGKCVQVDIRIYKDAQNVYNHIIYWVILDNERGSTKVAENDIFGSIEEATAALAFLLNPTPTPSVTTSVTPTPNPTQTNTPTVTTSVTPTPTNTVTPTITQTPIPSGTAVPTMTPTPSVTTSITPTATMTPTPSITPTNTITPTATMTPTPSVTTSTISGNDYQSIVLNDNPIAFWRMNESSGLIINELVSNNIATFSTDPIRNVDGISGKCLGLDTSQTNYATIDTPITIDKGYSIEFWTKPETLNNGYSAIITDNTITGIVMSPVFKFRVLFTGTNQIESESIDAVELSEWNHVCVVLNLDGIVNYYVNGVLVSITYTNTDPINLTTIHGNNNYVGYSLDELAIYDYVLTEEQIFAHYLNGIAEISPQITLTPTPTVTPTPSPTMVTPTPTPSPIVSNDFTMIMRYYDDNDQQYLYNYVNYIENATDTTSSNALHFIDDENPLSDITNQYDFIYKDLPIIIAFTSNSITSILSKDDGNNQLEIVQLSDYVPVMPNKIVVKVKAYDNELFMLTKLGDNASYIEQMNYSATNLQIDYPAKLNEMYSSNVNSFNFEKFNNVFVIVEFDSLGDKKFSSYKYENNSLTLINTYSDILFTYFNIVKISNTLLAIIGFSNGVPDIRLLSVDDTLGLQLVDSDNTTFTAIPTASYAYNNILFMFEAGTPSILRTYDNNLQLLDSMNVNFNINSSYQYRNYIIFNTDTSNLIIVKFDPVTGELSPEVVTTQMFGSGKIFGIINKLNA